MRQRGLACDQRSARSSRRLDTSSTYTRGGVPEIELTCARQTEQDDDVLLLLLRHFASFYLRDDSLRAPAALINAAYPPSPGQLAMFGQPPRLPTPPEMRCRVDNFHIQLSQRLVDVYG
jgi:hypothetical protein